MARRMLVALCAAAIVSLANAEEKKPTWYDLPKNARDVVTAQVGEINEETQGVVTIYSAEAGRCRPCAALEEKIKESRLMERLTEEGIVFRVVKEKDGKNKHVWGFDTGLPRVVIDDLGKNFEGDEKENVADRLHQFDGLEEEIRRRALDQSVSVLTGNQPVRVLEAIASERFAITYGSLNEGKYFGFTFRSKNPDDPKTLQEKARLHVISGGARIIEGYISTQRESMEYAFIKDKTIVPATFEEARELQGREERCLDKEKKETNEKLKEHYTSGTIFFPKRLEGTESAKHWEKFARERGREFVYFETVPTDEQFAAIETGEGYRKYFEDEIKFLKGERDRQVEFWRKVRERNVWYFPCNVADEIPRGNVYVEGQVELGDRDELLKMSEQEPTIWVQVPVANLVHGPQTYGNMRLFYGQGKDLKKNR